MGLGALVLDLTVGRRSREASAAPAGAVSPAPGTAPNFLDLQAEKRHGRLFADPLDLPKSPAGFRAEDVVGQADLEGFVPVEEAARRMEITEAEVMELTRSAYLLSRWNRGRLLVRPGIV